MIEEQVRTKEEDRKAINLSSINLDISDKKYTINRSMLDNLPARNNFYEEEKYYSIPQTSYTHEFCPICGKQMHRHDLCALEEYNVYNCIECGSIFFDPPIDRNAIDDFLSYLEPEAIHSVGYKRKIEKYKKIFTNIFPRAKGKTFLNVDSKQGYVVEAAKSLEFKTIKAIDRYDFYTEFQKKNFGEKFFETMSIEEYISENEEPADIVVSIENLCLQPNIEEYISNLAKVTKKGGALYLEEVDGNSFFLPSDLSRWYYINPPITCNFISKVALYQLLEKHGFKVKKKFFSFSCMMKILAVKVK